MNFCGKDFPISFLFTALDVNRCDTSHSQAPSFPGAGPNVRGERFSENHTLCRPRQKKTRAGAGCVAQGRNHQGAGGTETAAVKKKRWTRARQIRRVTATGDTWAWYVAGTHTTAIVIAAAATLPAAALQ